MKPARTILLFALLCGCGKQEPFVLKVPSGTNQFSITISNATGEAKAVRIGAEDYGLDPGRYLVISNYAIDLYPPVPAKPLSDWEYGYYKGLRDGKEIELTTAYCFMQTGVGFTNFYDFEDKVAAFESNAQYVAKIRK